VAFNRIYEPEISNALLSLLASGVAFSIVIRALCRADRVRDEVRVERWAEGICLSDMRHCTSLPLTVRDICRYIHHTCANLQRSHLFIHSITYSFVRSSCFIDWWTCKRIWCQEFYWPIKHNALPASFMSCEIDFIITDVSCINGCIIKIYWSLSFRSKFLAATKQINASSKSQISILSGRSPRFRLEIQRTGIHHVRWPFVVYLFFEALSPLDCSWQNLVLGHARFYLSPQPSRHRR